MSSRLDLQNKLEDLLGNRNVYYNPPENLVMKYPCIRYSKQGIDTRYANDKKYKKMNRYDLIVITKQADPEIVDELLELPYSSLGTPYKAENLHHYPITLYH